MNIPSQVALLILLCHASIGAQVCDLYFSEYVEGTGGNDALEIFNPSFNSKTLDDYVIYRYDNGSSIASDSFFLHGQLLPGDVFVIANPQSLVPNIDTLHSVCVFSGDDAIALINKSSEDTLDIIGVIGDDPGVGWDAGGVNDATKDHTLVRKDSIGQGNTNWNTSSMEWDVFVKDVTIYLGYHNTNVNCDINIWNGDHSNDWFAEENWSLKHIPTDKEKVIIPNSSMVIIPYGFVAFARLLELGQGAELIINGSLDILIN